MALVGWHSVLRLKDNSTMSGSDPRMFFAGPSGTLDNIAFEKLAFDGNAENNPLGLDNRNCCAIFIGTGVCLTGLRVENCRFANFPGANVVLVLDQVADPAATFSSDVLILGNTFCDNRKAPGNRDHSTVSFFADNVRVIGNRFALPADATELQKQFMVACELHGSASCFNNNTLSYYAGGVIFSYNVHHDCLAQAAIGNVMSDLGYRAFDVNIYGSTGPTVRQANIAANVIHFGTVRALTNPVLMSEYGVDVPFLKVGVCFAFGIPDNGVLAVVGSVNVTGNTFDGDTKNQVSHTMGVAGIWGGGGYQGITNLNASGNTFRRLSHGIWQDPDFSTLATHGTIVGNRFEDLADPTTDPDPGQPISPPAHSARAILMASSSSPATGTESVDISSNSFVNGWDEPTYQYGLYIGPGVRFLFVGQNWYHNIQQADIELAVLGPGTVVTSWSNVTDKPAGTGSGCNITLRFSYDAASTNWREIFKSSPAIPN